MKIAIVTINKPSLNSAIKLDNFLQDYDTTIFTSKKTPLEDIDRSKVKLYDKLDDILSESWNSYDIIITILAIGAVIRKIAPYLKSKESDPAIIVINLTLDKVVPLLSGHLGGGNEFSEILSTKLNAINFITTATDQTKTIAFEMIAKKNDWDIKNLKALANISNRLLNKQKVKVATYKNIFYTLDNNINLELIDFKNIDTNTVIISPFYDKKYTNLLLQPKIFLGIGCNRDTSFEDINKAVFEFLTNHNLQFSQIKNIASFEAKQDEQGLLQFAKKYNFNIQFYNKDDINNLSNNFSKSASTKFFGLKGVAEPSSILVCTYKELIIKKEVFYKSITISASI